MAALPGGVGGEENVDKLGLGVDIAAVSDLIVGAV
jgi:hypothetical protein